MFEHPGQSMIKAAQIIFWIFVVLGAIFLIVGLIYPYMGAGLILSGIALVVSAYFAALGMATIGKIQVDLEDIKRQRAGGQSAPGTCPNCGSPVAPGTAFCSKCGTKVQ